MSKSFASYRGWAEVGGSGLPWNLQGLLCQSCRLQAVRWGGGHLTTESRQQRPPLAFPQMISLSFLPYAVVITLLLYLFTQGWASGQAGCLRVTQGAKFRFLSSAPGDPDAAGLGWALEFKFVTNSPSVSVQLPGIKTVV